MDLNIFKGEDFYLFGKVDLSVFQKEENKYMYIPSKSGHQKHTIWNFVIGELRRYVRICTQEISFVRVKNKFFKRLRLRGYKKFFLKRLFGKVKYSSRISLLKLHPQQSEGGWVLLRKERKWDPWKCRTNIPWNIFQWLF